MSDQRYGGEGRDAWDEQLPLEVIHELLAYLREAGPTLSDELRFPAVRDRTPRGDACSELLPLRGDNTSWRFLDEASATGPRVARCSSFVAERMLGWTSWGEGRGEARTVLLAMGVFVASVLLSSGQRQGAPPTRPPRTLPQARALAQPTPRPHPTAEQGPSARQTRRGQAEEQPPPSAAPAHER